MIKALAYKLQAEGAAGLIRSAGQRILVRHLQAWEGGQPMFAGKAGLELGGPSPIFRNRGLFPVYGVAARVDNCNFSTETAWEDQIQPGPSFRFRRGLSPGMQFIAEATRLGFLDSGSYDFVLASHMIEHTANPVQALIEWLRVLKPGGTLLLVVPHRDGTFDHRRPITPLQHLVDDYRNGTGEDDLTHLPEILQMHDLRRDPAAGTYAEFSRRCQDNLRFRCLHHHVFDAHLVVELVDLVQLQVLAVEVVHPYHIFVLARKPAAGQVPDNRRFCAADAAYRRTSPFPSDRRERQSSVSALAVAGPPMSTAGAAGSMPWTAEVDFQDPVAPLLPDAEYLHQSRKELVGNAGWNLAGMVVPAIVALFCIPVLVSGLGAEGFGLLSLALSILGYFGLFDLGLGRALTKVVAEHPGMEQWSAELAATIWTGIAAMTLLGCAAGAAVAATVLLGWLGHLGVAAPQLPQVGRAIYWLAASLPLLLAGAGLRGVLEGRLDFKATNAVRMLLGVATFLVPVAVLPLSHDLGVIVAAMVVVRAAVMVFYWLALRHRMPQLAGQMRLHWAKLPALLRLGGWMTVSNVISPMMIYFDRFFVSGVLGAAALSYYVTPFEAVTKLLVIPAAFASVLFPGLARSRASSPEAVAALSRQGSGYISWALLPPVLLTVLLAGTAMRWWLGAEFELHSATVLRLLAAGVLLNGLAHVPFALVQACGRADWTAKMHLLEALIYIPLLYLLLKWVGVDGAAWAWLLRAGADYLAVSWLARRALRALAEPGR